MIRSETNQSLQVFLRIFKIPERLKKVIPKILSKDEMALLGYLADKKVKASEIFLRFPDLPANILHSSFEKGYLERHIKQQEKFYTSCTLEGILKRYIIHSPEYHRLSPNDRSLVQECITEWALKEMKESERPEYRVLPIEVAIEDKRQLVPFYLARAYIQDSPKIAVVNCLCRSTHRNCDKPLDVCLSLNDKAEFFINRRIGKEISVQEALEILDKARQHDLVHAVNDVENPEYLCNCCDCCCMYIQGLKKFGIFTSMGRSGFVARLSPGLCDVCGLCIEKCLFRAISLENENIVIHEDECFGCGLCSYHCPQSAIKLIQTKKEESS